MSEYLIFLFAFAASAAAPGPEIAAVVSRSLSHGVRSSAPLAIGLIAGKLAMLTAAIVGVAALLKVVDPFFLVLKLAGGAYLIWLGVKKWRRAGRVLAETEASSAGSFAKEVGLGLAMTLSNPLAIAFYVAMLPGVIDVAGVTLTTYVTLCSILVVVMALVVLGYGLLAEGARRAFRLSKAKAHVERASGAMMVGAGALVVSR